MQNELSSRVVSGPIKLSRNIPAAATAMPVTGHTL